MTLAWVPTSRCRSRFSDLRYEITKGPVAPKNIVRNDEIAPVSQAKRRMIAGGVKNTDQRMKSPTPICTAAGGRAMATLPPMDRADDRADEEAAERRPRRCSGP